MNRCARCAFTGDLAAHAAASGHPLCIVCRTRSLGEHEPLVCGRCESRTRSQLAEIVEHYALLPAELVHHAGEPIPGGDALVMLAGGSGCSDRDAVASDPESVAATLGSWEDLIRAEFGHGAASVPPSVASAAGYLQARLSLMARTFAAFDEFAGDVRRLSTRLAAATATGDWPLTGAPCLDCGRNLEREFTATGLADAWWCRGCKRGYTQAEYLLAMRSELDERRRGASESIREHGGWGLPWQVAAMLGLPVETVRTWAKRLVIAVRCDVESRALEVSWVDAHDRATRHESARSA